ncbi:MAG: ATP-binding cassette domain-containing protein [Peptococcaceae bacterium]|nr:ATP-binding cassette domain-containing protein [Peptococcaceae bacterium]
MSIVAVEDLVKKFKDLTAVDKVGFTVERGEIFGFLGPNGAGKSTTIQMLATLLKPTGGRAWIDGHDTVREQFAVRQSIGLVFQDPSLDGNLTAMENLDFHARLYNVDPKVLPVRRRELLEMVELSDRTRDLVKTFSGGMKRRLEIARGLLHHPAVLFLDEPTVGLDPQTRNHIWTYIRSLRTKGGVTIFLTTHYMDEAENCDRIAIIDHGQIVALDTPAGLKQMVGKDIVNLTSKNVDRLAGEIAERFGLKGNRLDGQLQLETEQGDLFIPRLLAEVGSAVDSVNLHKPTLDDVFLKLTGRAIREESISAGDAMRTMMKRRLR